MKKKGRGEGWTGVVAIGDKGVANYFLAIEKGSLFFFSSKKGSLKKFLLVLFWNGCFINAITGVPTRSFPVHTS